MFKRESRLEKRRYGMLWRSGEWAPSYGVLCPALGDEREHVDVEGGRPVRLRSYVPSACRSAGFAPTKQAVAVRCSLPSTILYAGGHRASGC